MQKLRQEIGIRDSFNIIKKSNNLDAPLSEALVNSLDAIKQRQSLGETFTPQITISLHYQSCGLLEEEMRKDICSIVIEDNGIGFVSENFERFKKLADKSKKLNNRGTGKIQIFYRFKKIMIDSIFYEDGEYQSLEFVYTVDDDISSQSKIVKSSELKTVVTMTDFYGGERENRFFERYFDDIGLLKRDILSKLLLRLFLEKNAGFVINLKLYLDENIVKEEVIEAKDVPSPDKSETVLIKKYQILPPKKGEEEHIEWESTNEEEVLKIDRFKLPSSLIEKNEISLCSKNIKISKFRISDLPTNINFEKIDFDGFRYITSISGAILDNEDHVNHSVDGFNIKRKRDVENEIREGSLFDQEGKYIFWDEIETKLSETLLLMYSELDKLRDEKEKDVANIAKKFGISLELTSEVKVTLNDSEEEIAKKLFQAQAKRFATQNIEISKTYEEIIGLESQKLDPSSEEYDKNFNRASQKLLELIPNQNRDELARYIIRRDMVVRLLRLALKKELIKQKEWSHKKSEGCKFKEDQEGIIHDLFFKRKQKGLLNDLWILNEEFTHFYGCSDLPLDQLEVDGVKLLREGIDLKEAMQKVGLDGAYLKKRPDIFLFPEEGKCVLIEFKSPDEDVTVHLHQLPKYASLIANYSTKPITQFYGFLIGEKIDRIGLDRFTKAIYGGYWFTTDPVKDIDTEMQIANLYQEVIPLSLIADRAENRNKSFANKLGIGEILEDAQNSLRDEIQD